MPASLPPICSATGASVAHQRVSATRTGSQTFGCIQDARPYQIASADVRPAAPTTAIKIHVYAACSEFCDSTIGIVGRRHGLCSKCVAGECLLSLETRK